jgi:signal transduction histidine kinase
MEISTIAIYSLNLIALILFLVVLYLKKKGNLLRSGMQDLFQLNQSVKQDALDFLRQAWPILKRSGMAGFYAKVQWFGESIEIQNGDWTTINKTHHIRQPQIEVQIQFNYSKLHGESRLIAELVETCFIQLLDHNLFVKDHQFLTTQHRLQRHQLFAQHDLKNIAQFIKLLNFQIQTQTKNSSEKLFQQLQLGLPSVLERAERILDPIHHRIQLSPIYQTTNLNQLIQRQADNIPITIEITGQIEATLPQELLKEVFQNVLNNFKQHNRSSDKVQVVLSQNENAMVMEFWQACLAMPILPTERLFEPYWTTSESGMGLGLYLTRELLNRVEGEIQFQQQPNQVGFKIQLKNSHATN